MNEDTILGRMAVEKGLVSDRDLAEAMKTFEESREAGSQMPLGEFLVREEYITRHQLESLETRRATKEEAKKQGERAGKELIPGYEFLKEIGQGGMGAVYLARQLSMDRYVAIKVLPRKYSKDKEFIERFQREARISGKLEHVNVVRGVDVSEFKGHHYFVMEYVDGRSLDKIIREMDVLPEEEALHVTMQVARALQYAHEKGIVHRDIKPGNILITGDRVAKVCDMGLAKLVGTESYRTATGLTIGTPHYISPEQARGEEDIDSRTDIYSLGATLYHCVTGTTPFSGTSVAVILTKRLTEEVPWPQDVNTELSIGCCVLIEKMMAKDREDRYRDMSEVLKDMEYVIDGKGPATVQLKAGRSSVARAGVIETKQVKAVRKRPVRRTTPVPRRVTPRPSRVVTTRNPLGLWIGAATGVVILLLIILSFSGGRRDRAPIFAPSQRIPSPVGAPVKAPPADRTYLREMFDYARNWETEHPEDFDGAVEKYRMVLTSATGTSWETAAREAMVAVEARRAAAERTRPSGATAVGRPPAGEPEPAAAGPPARRGEPEKKPADIADPAGEKVAERNETTARQKAAPETNARYEWASEMAVFENARSLTGRNARRAREALTAFRSSHGKTEFAASVAGEIAALEKKITDGLQEVSIDNVKEVFKGTVTRFDETTCYMEITYDFNEPVELTEDWKPVAGTWAVKDNRLEGTSDKPSGIWWIGETKSGKDFVACTVKGDANGDIAMMVAGEGRLVRQGVVGVIGAAGNTGAQVLERGNRVLMWRPFKLQPNRDYRMEMLRQYGNAILNAPGLKPIRALLKQPVTGTRIGLSFSAGSVEFDNIVIKTTLDQTWLQTRIAAAAR